LKALVTLSLLGCFASSPAAAQPVFQHLRLIAPAAPGGGWDQTARVMQQVLQAAGVVHTSSVENIPGAAGTIGLARLVSAERGNGDVAMLSGLIMLAAVITHRSSVTLEQVTPIARLLGEYEVIVVPAGSRFSSLQDLIRVFKEHPESISWGGGSAGGTDQILAGLFANAVGVAPRRVNYIAFSGGGESMAAILGGQVTVGVNGLAEFAPHIESGAIRVLGISSAARLPDLDAPTLREQGVDVVLENWRSVVAPPGISDSDRHRLESALASMVGSAPWRDALTRYRWNDRYLGGDAFARFVASEEARVGAILADLGLSEPDRARDATPIGFYPLLVLSSLAACVLVFAWTLRRSSPLDAGRPSADWRALAFVGAGVTLDVLLVERLGFLIASTGLFWLTARAFDRSRPWRDALFAFATSLASYVLFTRLLQVMLPAGVLSRWL
jgi:putative tricarboxylic transport membrane protein